MSFIIIALVDLHTLADTVFAVHKMKNKVHLLCIKSHTAHVSKLKKKDLPDKHCIL